MNPVSNSCESIGYVRNRMPSGHQPVPARSTQLEQAAELIGFAIVVFVATNLDDVFLLIAFFADPKLKVRQIVTGQYVGIGVYQLRDLLRCARLARRWPLDASLPFWSRSGLARPGG